MELSLYEDAILLVAIPDALAAMMTEEAL